MPLQNLPGDGPIAYHVTERAAARAIALEGFLGGWGDVGFGVYTWTHASRAQAYAAQKGWDGLLEDPVVLVLRDPALVRIDPWDVHHTWDAEAYTAMLWAPMDEDSPDTPWRPSFLGLLGEDGAVVHGTAQDLDAALVATSLPTG